MANSNKPDTENVIPLDAAPAEVAFERDKEANIHQRIHAIMAEIPHIEKDREVNFGKTKFAYISHDAVTAHVRRAFIKHGVMVVPDVVERSDSTNRTELNVSASFVNIDRPEDYIQIHVPGYGVDPSDKGPGKAFSYAMKFAYLKILMLNTGDDIEEHQFEHDRETTAADVAAENTKMRGVIESWATTFRTALESAASVDEIVALEKVNAAALMDAPEATRDWFIDLIEKRKSIVEVGND